MSTLIANIVIAGTGHALPARSVISEELDVLYGFSAGYLAETTGVQSRIVCANESQIDLAVAASKAALSAADVSTDEVDLVLGACAIPYQPLPATAPLVMRELGIADGEAAAFDVNSTCLSFVSALDIAVSKLSLGQCKTALIFASEIASRALPWEEQPEVAALFGDGAAAVVLKQANVRCSVIHASLLRSYPSHFEACEIGSGGTRIDFQAEPEAFAQNATFRMDGKSLYRVTHRHFPRFVKDLLAQSGWSADEVDVVVPHQASPHALQHMVEKTGLGPEKVINISTHMGNQIAASIPSALDIAVRDGRIVRGSKVLMLGTSAGVSFGGMAFEF